MYSLFSALIMHVYQMRSHNQSIVTATQARLKTCMNALVDVSRVWLVAKMVHTLFESILGNKVLEERLQKAAGRRHVKNKAANGANAKAKETPPNETNDAPKRKFDDMELGFSGGPPAPNMSYERSRPQSPAMTPSRDLPQQTQAHQQQGTRVSAGSPTLRPNNDAFLGTSRSNTRPTLPTGNQRPIPITKSQPIHGRSRLTCAVAESVSGHANDRWRHESTHADAGQSVADFVSGPHRLGWA